MSRYSFDARRGAVDQPPRGERRSTAGKGISAQQICGWASGLYRWYPQGVSRNNPYSRIDRRGLKSKLLSAAMRTAQDGASPAVSPCGESQGLTSARHCYWPQSHQSLPCKTGKWEKPCKSLQPAPTHGISEKQPRSVFWLDLKARL